MDDGLIHYSLRQQSRRHRVFIAVCLDVCFSARYLKKLMQLITKRLRTVPRAVLETHLICGQRVKSQGHESQKHCRCGFSRSCLLVICPIAIAYSMGQIIKPVCICPCVRLRALSRSHFLKDFTEIGTDVKPPKSKNEFVRGKYRTTPSPILPQNFISGEEVLKMHAGINSNPVTAFIH